MNLAERERDYLSVLEDKVRVCPSDLGYPENAPDEQRGQEEMNQQTVWTWVLCGLALHGLRSLRFTVSLPVGVSAAGIRSLLAQ